VLGAGLGSASTMLFAYTGIDLSGYSAGASALGLTTTVSYPELTARNLISSDLSVVLVVLLVALYPAVKAAGLRPVEAIRHV
jgi:ABC-type lipoprotein release transport system permease subunit